MTAKAKPLDANPFDEDSGDNPFENDDANPFEQNYKKSATGPLEKSPTTTRPAPTPGGKKPVEEDEINPFDTGAAKDKATKAVSKGKEAAAETSKSIRDSAAGVAASAKEAGGEMTASAMKLKEEELRKREAQLEKFEREIAEREARLPYLRRPNWPICFPITHHDISIDIPVEGRSIMRKLYFEWWWNAIAIFMNFIAILAALLTPGMGTGRGLDMVIASIGLGLGTPVTFLAWYKPAYTGMRKDKASNLVWFFFAFFLHICICILWAIGLQQTGGAGVITMIDMYTAKKTTTGVFATISFVMWVFSAFFSMYLFLLVHGYYRGRGHTLAKAQQEATVSVAKASVSGA